MTRPQIHLLPLSVLALVCGGCSCSRIPESPPGPGPVSEIRHFNSGATVPVVVANPNAPANTPPPANAYVNPTPPQPTYVRPGMPTVAPVANPSQGATQRSGLGDSAPDGPTLKPSLPK